jgi:hypothetical protein
VLGRVGGQLVQRHGQRQGRFRREAHGRPGRRHPRGAAVAGVGREGGPHQPGERRPFPALAGEQVVRRGERHQPGLEIGVEALGRVVGGGAGPPRLVRQREGDGEAVHHPVVQLVHQ